MKLQTIKQAIELLEPHELTELRQWLDGYDAPEKGKAPLKMDKPEEDEVIKKRLQGYQGSLKGYGFLKKFIEKRLKIN